jgi:hypothetical protein
MNENDLNHHVRVAEQILSALDCPRALTVSIMVRHQMWDDIATLTCDPKGFNDSESFFRSYQATKLLSKASWLPTSFDKRDIAVRKFWEAESACANTNVLFKAYREQKLKLLPQAERVFHSARLKIGKVLGDRLYAWTELCDFGPGSDCSTSGGWTSAYNKLSDPGDVTIGAYPLLNTFCALTSLGRLFRGNPKTRMLDVQLTRGNKVTFVPKNAKTDRSIAIEPRWNMFMQKGVGTYIRRRLKLFGVNLDDQGLNQARAIWGSWSGSLATLDLASASDTVSKELVQALLPEPWVDVLGALRSPAFFLDGSWHSYEKWSSMGNGYTFELESLIFWALASSIDENASVYGDDIIVASELVDQVKEILNIAGFTVNDGKSFSDGAFRESCGTDAFIGTTVTPIYWKEPLHESGTLSLVNSLTRLATRLSFAETRTKALKAVWKFLVYKLPKRFQQRGPATIATVVHDSFETWNAYKRWGWDGWFINCWLPKPRRFEYRNWEPAVVSMNFQPSSRGFQVRDRVVWKKETIFVPCGYRDIGPWI